MKWLQLPASIEQLISINDWRSLIKRLDDMGMSPSKGSLNYAHLAMSERVRACSTWRQRVLTCFPDAELFAPATDLDLRSVKQVLGHDLQMDLEGLLSESNGVRIRPCSDLIYSTTQIARFNQEFRDPQFLADLRMPFDNLLFFGGREDPFAFAVLKNRTIDHGVFQWDHETDGRVQYAYGLSDYLIKKSLFYHAE